MSIDRDGLYDVGDNTRAQAVVLVGPNGRSVEGDSGGFGVTGDWYLRNDWTALPGSYGTANPMYALGNGAASVQVAVHTALKPGTAAGLYIVTAYHASTTYSVTPAGEGPYTTSNQGGDRQTCVALAAAINAANAGANEPAAEVLQVRYNGTLRWAVHVYRYGTAATPSAQQGEPTMTMDGSVSGGSGTCVVAASPSTLDWRLYASSKETGPQRWNGSATVAGDSVPQIVPNTDSALDRSAGSYGCGDTYDCRDYSHVGVHVTDMTFGTLGHGGSVVPLIAVLVTEASPS